jgi:hypothetical protein
MTRDPLGEYGGINLYGFVGNNPVNDFDPFGLDSLLFTGKKVYWLDDFGMPTAAYDAISGPFGNGRLPDGKYFGSNLRLRSKKGMVCNKFGWSLDLNYSLIEMNYPQLWRFDLRIHPDQSPKGTEGCIGMTCNGDERRLYNDLKKYFDAGNKLIPLEVRYGK